MSSPTDEARGKRYRDYLEAELEAAALYERLAEVEPDRDRAVVFRGLVAAELRHAARWGEKLGMDSAKLEPIRVTLKVRAMGWAARLLGTGRVLPFLLRLEAREMKAYSSDPEARDMVAEERRHAQTLRDLSRRSPGGVFRAGNGALGRGGALRAGVLGVNDGLVSNFSLVTGVAGGTDNATDIVLLAGVAGLLAGAFSMAAGEYVSMRSQRDIYEYELEKESVELREWPEEEEEELALIYRAKGLPEEDAARIAKHVMADSGTALDTMAREELGLDPSELGSPWQAAGSSFIAFVAGAVIPILPYLFGAGGSALTLSAALSAGALVAVGSALAVVSRKSVAWGGLRMLLAGGAAAAVTYGVGRLLGVTVLA